MMRALLGCALLVMCSACAPIYFNTQLETPGALRDTSEVAKRAAEVPPEQVERVGIHFGQFPEGFAYTDGRLAVEPGYSHRIIGKVDATPGTPMANMYWGWFRHPKYHPDIRQGRIGYCKFENVLMWMTVTVLMYTPLSWPCNSMPGDNSPDDIAERKRALTFSLKQMAVAAGGDAILLTSLGKLETIDAKSHTTLGTLEMMGATGYVVELGTRDPSFEPAASEAPLSPAVPPPAPAQPSVEERLRKLDELHEKGVITDDEHKTRRQELLQQI